jgi:hypothetical protein
LNLDVDALRQLALRAPGAAVVTTYDHVTMALKVVLARRNAELTQGDAPEHAQLAARLGLVSEHLVNTVKGLAVLKDLSLRDGAGTGLTVDQANQFIDLASAALYVIGHARA